MSNLSFWIACILDGIANGFIYGLLALALVVMYRTNKLFNFSQTAVIAFVMIIAAGFLEKMPLYVLAGSVLACGFVVGVLLHVFVMRPITENRQGSHMTEVLAVFGLMTVFQGLATFVFGDTPVAFPSLFPDGQIQIDEFVLSYNSLGVIGTSLALVALIGIFFKLTNAGLLMEAVAENPTSARLRGIRVSNILSVAWGMTGLISMMAGLLIAPLVFVSPNMLAPVFGYSLIAVVIGGLESPSGAVLGGIAVGVVENIAGNVPWLGSELKFASVFALLLFVLILRPRGLFGRADFRRV